MADCVESGIDSNVVDLRFAEEECPGILPDSGVVWYPAEPNTYPDFGGNNTLTQRNPINSSRQRSKGIVTDRAVTAGWQTDVTQNSLSRLLPGFLFADAHTKTDYTIDGAAADITVAIEASGLPSLNSTILDFTTLELTPGEWIFIGGDTTAAQFQNKVNNGFKRIRSIAAHKIVIDKSHTTMVADTGTGKTIAVYLGDFLKNEKTRALIKRKTFQLERTLGSLDGLDPPQAEYIEGAYPNQLTFTIPAENKLTADLTFIGMQYSTATQQEGLKAGTRPDLVEADAYNSTNDVMRLNMSIVDPDNANPETLFGYITEGNIVINNNVSQRKAVGVLGGIGANVGDFEVSGSVTAYFTSVEAVRAVQNNADVTFDFLLLREGGAVIYDQPLVALGGGLLNVTKDAAIMMPLTSAAARGAKVDPLLDFTLGITTFTGLPALAATL